MAMARVTPPDRIGKAESKGSRHARPAGAIVALAVLLALVELLYSFPSAAQRVVVPPELQVELFAKLVAYDRNFRARAGSNALVVLVTRGDMAQSILFASSIKSALDHVDRLGGLPHRTLIVK